MERLEAKTENNHEKMEVIQQNTEASAILGGTAHGDSPRNTPKKKTD
jgi:tRNA U34 5-carboxymethylaminomethyl modifying enzyme MnmG/GidA